MSTFVHLAVHTEYSIADGLANVRDLVRRTADLSMPAVAMTDRANLYGLVKFYDACHDFGVKPIVGVDLRFRVGEEEPARCVLLAASRTGYAHLLELVSQAWLEGGRGLVRRDWIFERAGGLIALCGPQSDMGRALTAGDADAAGSLAEAWLRPFGDRLYLAVQRTGRGGESRHLAAAVELAAGRGLPVAATNDVRFLRGDDFEAHETRVCIQDGRTLNDPRRERRYSASQYLRSPDEMTALFADLPEAVENAAEIAMRCNLEVEMVTYHLPVFSAPEGKSLETVLDRAAATGLDERLAGLVGEPDPSVVEGPAPERPEDAVSVPNVAAYRHRLDYELGVIKQMGFAGYYLIVAEFVNWAKDQGIPVGPGRGSGAGSLVAWSLGITDVDPLAYDLIFERFLNPERVSMPDFDVDFCMDGRDAVIGHVAERYGAAAVGQIATFNTMAAKAVVRDVARVQGKPYGLADKLSKLIPFEVGMTLPKAVAQETELRQFIDDNPEVAEIMEMAYKLEGTVRNVGVHAGGVVIAPAPLTHFVPLYADDGGSAMSQFDKDDVERAGLVKFDFLGLRTLTIVDWAMQAVNAARAARDEPPIDLDAVAKDDPETYALLRTGHTSAIFQLESPGMQDLIRRLQPDNINDIIALVALFRPGPLQSGAVDDYIDRKHGRARVRYPHPLLEQSLKDTYGVMLYQEQVMSAAQSLAGFSLGQADLLRRAMGKKKPEEMARVRQQYMDGARRQGVDENVASGIFDQMEKFAGYAFVKGHATAYGIIAFQSAWLKTHHPAAFMAAVLSANMREIDKVVATVDEVRRMRINLRPPDVNASHFRFSAVEGAQREEILYGLGAVRGIGEGAVQEIVAEREARGPFRSLSDFCSRTDAATVGKRVVEALIRSGAMDGFGAAGEPLEALRGRLWEDAPAALQGAEQAARDAALGVSDMFGGAAAPAPSGPAVAARPWTRRERLNAEKEALGLYLTGHPIEDYAEEIRRFKARRIAALANGQKSQVVAGLVVSYRTRRSRRGGAMGFAELDDRSGRMEASVFGETLDNSRGKLQKDAVLVFEGDVQEDDFSGRLRMRVNAIYSIEEARARFARRIDISMDGDAVGEGACDRLEALLMPHRGNGAADAPQRCPVVLTYRCAEAEARLALGDAWRVAPTDALLADLRGAFGAEHVELVYG